MAKQVAKETAWEKNAARLAMVNEGTCEWLVAIHPVGAADGKEWRLPVGKSAEAMLTAGEYLVEQKLVADAGAVQTRSFGLTLEAGQVYRWRLVNLFSADQAERALPPAGGAGR